MNSWSVSTTQEQESEENPVEDLVQSAPSSGSKPALPEVPQTLAIQDAGGGKKAQPPARKTKSQFDHNMAKVLEVRKAYTTVSNQAATLLQTVNKIICGAGPATSTS